MIEQKSLDKDLRKGIKQSDGSLLTPFQQVKRPRWIVTCNFAEFLIYDMEQPNGEPEQILLKSLSKEYYRLQFLVDTGSDSIHKELYDLILQQYQDPGNPDSLRNLNMLCVRLIFCLYAGDSSIFGQHKIFWNYLKQFQPKQNREEIIKLFKNLEMKSKDRESYLDEDLLAFPYVNVGLFADENIAPPDFRGNC